MTDPDTRHGKLTGAQIRAAEALVTGATDGEAAEAAGVSRQTVNVWKNRDPRFQAELNARRHEVWDSSVDRVRSLIPVALDGLAGSLQDRDEGGVKAASAFLKLVGMGAVGYRPTGHTDAREIAKQRINERRATDFYSRGLEDLGEGVVTDAEIDEELRRMGEVAELESRYGTGDPAG